MLIPCLFSALILIAFPSSAEATQKYVFTEYVPYAGRLIPRRQFINHNPDPTQPTRNAQPIPLSRIRFSEPTTSTSIRLNPSRRSYQRQTPRVTDTHRQSSNIEFVDDSERTSAEQRAHHENTDRSYSRPLPLAFQAVLTLPLHTQPSTEPRERFTHYHLSSLTPPVSTLRRTPESFDDEDVPPLALEPLRNVHPSLTQLSGHDSLLPRTTRSPSIPHTPSRLTEESMSAFNNSAYSRFERSSWLPAIRSPEPLAPISDQLLECDHPQSHQFFNHMDPRYTLEERIILIKSVIENKYKTVFNPEDETYVKLLAQKSSNLSNATHVSEVHMLASPFDVKLNVIKRFGSLENFNTLATHLFYWLEDVRILPTLRYAIFNLLSDPQHYKFYLDLDQLCKLKYFEMRLAERVIATIPHALSPTLKPLQPLETMTDRNGSIFRYVTTPRYDLRVLDTPIPLIKKLKPLFAVLEMHNGLLAPNQHALQKNKFEDILLYASPLERAAALHFRANTFLFHLELNPESATETMNPESVRRDLELATHVLEGLNYDQQSTSPLERSQAYFRDFLLNKLNILAQIFKTTYISKT